jgi:thymidylate synthase (FAD)
MSNQVPVLDHGYVQLVESWGSDERIIEAARMSTAKGFLGWGTSNEPGDEKLLRYLYEHKHATPFEMAGMVIEAQAPIFVFREWHRHRTQSYNEMSARYVQMPDLHYIPSIDRIKRSAEASRNKQAAGAGVVLSDDEARIIQKRLADTQREIYAEYDALINIYGLSKEIARLNTPVSRYSRMRASANLRNWLAFLTLRMDKAAQEEIRLYATAVGGFVRELFPRTWELFVEGMSDGR